MFRKKQSKVCTYDKENQIPVLKCSICTGEQVAGFQDKRTGKIEEITVIRSARELEQFMEDYGLMNIKKIY